MDEVGCFMDLLGTYTLDLEGDWKYRGEVAYNNADKMRYTNVYFTRKVIWVL